MISIKNLKSGRRGADDIARYCEHRHNTPKGAAKGVGYYADRAPSAWHGNGAAALGLSGPVDRADLIACLEGRLRNGEDLSGRGNRGADRRLGVDLTISTPKSVSLLALVGGEERILAAHDRAVARALALIEREVVTARRGKGGVGHEYTAKLIAATYRHEDARPVNGHVDPQLHTHCILINATQRGDGAWSAMDLQFGEHSILMHLADAGYKAELAREIRQMGYEIRLTSDGFEMAEITDEQIACFSARRRQIDDTLRERGTTRDEASGKERADANIATREDKHQDYKSNQAWQWRQDAREAGLDLDAIHARAARSDNNNTASRDLSVEAVKSAVRHLSERETIISRNNIRLESLKAGLGHADIADVDHAISDKVAGLICAGDDKYTTREALYREQEILQRVRAGRGHAEALMPVDDADTYIIERQKAQGFSYSAGQRGALVLGLTSRDLAIGIVGAAGAGKTTAMKGIVEAARGQGYEIISIAPSTQAAKELQSAGADDTRTLASFRLTRRETDARGETMRNERRLIILDESGMVSARDMDLLLQKLDAEGGRLLLVGDPRQLSAVEAGSPFQQMIETDAIQHTRIDEIQRQKDERLREIAQHFARGHASRAVELARPYIHRVQVTSESEKPTAVARREAIASAVASDYLDRDGAIRDRTLIVSGTNTVRRLINERVRAGLREQGEIARDEIKIRALDKSELTREQQSRAESYQPGMVVRLSEGRGRERREFEYLVERTKDNCVVLRGKDDMERIWDPSRGRAAGVYQAREMALATGDWIVFRVNQGRGNERIRNGESAIVDRIEDGRAVVRLDKGREVVLDASRGQTIDYGWARTIHSAQGRTVDHVIVAGESSRVATAETAYVAVSREQYGLRIYTDNASALERNWGKFAEKQSAVQAVRDELHPNLSQLQQLRAEAARDLGRAGDLAKAREESEPEAPPPPKREREADQELAR